MESSRDSSVWRSLAVTFGGGLALGAVGMKLTQSALRPVEISARPDINPVADRLDRMEHRLERIEHTLTAPAQATPQLDQKVLEAIVGAVDARLHEHAGQVERRLADLEARITADLQTLRQQDRHITEVHEQGLAEAQRRFGQEVADLRAAVGEEMRQLAGTVVKAVSGQTAAQTEIQALHQRDERIVDATEQRLADMQYQLRQEMADLRAGIDDQMGRFGESVSQAVAAQVRTQVDARAKALEQSIEARVVTSAAAGTAARLEEQLAPLRAEVEHKERELAELRARLTESERAVLDVILAIGQVCRQAAERIGGGAAPPVSAAPPGETSGEAPAPEVSTAAVAQAPAIAPDEATAAAPEESAEAVLSSAGSPPEGISPPPPELAAEPTLDQAIPDFLQPALRSRPWRIPLVSSFLVTTGCLLLLRYL